MLVKVNGKSDSSWFVFEGAEDVFYVEDFPHRYNALFDKISDVTPKDEIDVFKKIINEDSSSNSYIEFERKQSKYGIVFDTQAFLMSEDGETIERISPSNDDGKNNVNISGDKDYSDLFTNSADSKDEDGEENENPFIKTDSDLDLINEISHLKDVSSENELKKRMKRIAGIEDQDDSEEDSLQYIIDNISSSQLELFPELLTGLLNLSEESREKIDDKSLLKDFANSSVQTSDGLNEWLESRGIKVPSGELGFEEMFPEDPEDMADSTFDYHTTRRVEFGDLEGTGKKGI